ncbi:MAG: hypothetical protein V4441_09360 [Pseudomonadota bacterium]
MPPKPIGSGGGGSGREVIFEFVPLGGSVRASAIDVTTGIEVQVVGPAGFAAQAGLQRVALTKLRQRLVREGYLVPDKDTPPDNDSPGSNSSGGGIIV